MSADTTHECPARGCRRRVQRSKLMCADHWAMVPAPVQRAVYAGYRSGDFSAHALAMKDAIDAVNAALEEQP